MSAENEINRRIAEALGWVTGGPRSMWLWKCSEYNGLMRFSPCSSLDDLAAYVLPEIIKRGLWEDFKVSLAMFGVATDALLIMGKPASIAAAALDVLTVREKSPAPAPEDCPECDGAGFWVGHDMEKNTCPACKGTGIKQEATK